VKVDLPLIFAQSKPSSHFTKEAGDQRGPKVPENRHCSAKLASLDFLTERSGIHRFLTIAVEHLTREVKATEVIVCPR
jgi:hypothetical protein